MSVLPDVNSDDIKVSVVVPIYNVEDYLEECLYSLEHQTLDKMQIILVDDGSTDSSADIARSFVARRSDLFSLYSKENGGQGSARNMAIPYCQGEYIAFFDSDDVADTCMYEKMYREAKKNNADCVRCGMVGFVDEGGKRVFQKNTLVPPHEINQDCMFFTMQVQPPIQLWRAAIIKGNNILFPETRGSEDIGFYLKIAPFIDRGTGVREPFVLRRLRGSSTSATATYEKLTQVFSVFDDVIDYYTDCSLMTCFKDKLEYSCLRLLFCSRMAWTGLLPKMSERRGLIKETLSYVNCRFPDRKSSSVHKGLMGLYLRFANEVLLYFATFVLGFRYRRILNIS